MLIISGIYNIGATSPHWPPVYWVMKQARMRSIEAHAAGIQEPANLNDSALLAIGTEHFAAHCAECHGAPGVPRGEIAEGMYPQPPDLARTVNRYTLSQLFWIVKHGIKTTCMPGWSDHTDDELWATVAFLRKLPGMNEADYGKLVMASMTHGGHHHHGGMEGMKMDMPEAEPDHNSKPANADTAMQGAVGDHDRERGLPLARRLFVALHGAVHLLVRRRPAIGEVLPDDPDGPEQRGNRPDNVHDPHVLRVPRGVRGNDNRAEAAEKQVGD